MLQKHFKECFIVEIPNDFSLLNVKVTTQFMFELFRSKIPRMRV